MKKLQLKPGVTYRGSAIINEYGQVQFTAYQQGTKPGNMHTVMVTPFFRISESKKSFKVSIAFDKASFTVLGATNRFALVLTQLTQYLKN